MKYELESIWTRKALQKIASQHRRLGKAALRSGFALALLLLAPSDGYAAGDVFDQFFRYTEKENKVVFEELPGESVDPFTGTLRLVQTDLTLPGRAGLDLRITRTYSSKIWGRSDLLDLEPALAEKEKSVLGWGWSFHMGRLTNPFALGTSGTCGGDFPVYEGPDGSARTFYPVAGSNSVFLSKDYWRLERACSALGGSGACVWSTDGVRYDFSSNFYNQYYVGTVPVWPLSAVVDRHGNSIEVQYTQDQTGAISSVKDSYGRIVSFAYNSSTDGKRLVSMTANGKTFSYNYTSYSTLAGARRFLTEVVPPAGPPHKYAYAHSAPVAENQGALSSVTYPLGGTVSYLYRSVNFFTGRDIVPFAVVNQRTVGGRGVTSGTWTYAYTSPGPGSTMHETTIDRPDGRRDTYSIYGFGYVAGLNRTGSTWMVGLTKQISRASGAEVESLNWDARTATPLTTGAYYSAPVYGTTCGPYWVWDTAIYSPVMTNRLVTRDEATYSTNYSSFDAYGQAQSVTESGQQTRTTTKTYFYKPINGEGTINLVRNRPTSEHVCVGNADCFDNAWTYNAPGYELDSETLSGVKTTFGYDSSGNLSTVTNAVNQTLTLDGYNGGYGIPTSIDFNGAFTMRRTAYWEGWIRSVTNGRGFTTSYEFDGIGRLTKMTPPIGDLTTYDYAPDGSWSRLTRGAYTKTTNRDGLGRITSTSDSEGVQTGQRWSNMGWAQFQSYSYDVSIGEVGQWLDFDGLGRTTTSREGYRPASGTCDAPGQCETDNEYSQNCVTTTIHRGPGDNVATTRCSTSFGSPDEQRLVKVTDPNGKTWQYAYSAYGKLTNVTAPLAMGNRSYIYDGRQFLTSETSSESGTVSYPSYNSIGQALTRTDARAVSWKYGYDDPLSRLRTVEYGVNSPDNMTQTYDDANNVSTLSSASGGGYTYSYDGLNRVTSQSWVFGGRTYTTGYHYDAAGCNDSLTYPTGTTLTMACDTENRIKSITLAGAVVVRDVKYYPSGQVRTMTYGNGKSTTVVLDDRARTKAITAAGVIDLRYDQYDGANNVKSFENRAVPNTLRTMSYDKLDRLESVMAPSLWGTATYQYDDLGNRTFKSPGGSISVSYNYDPVKNRLATMDGPADQLPRPLSLTWSAAGRLAATSDGASYLYDGLGRRVQKAVSGQSIVYHYDAAGRVLAETLPDGTKVRDYIYLAGKLIAIDGCVEGVPPTCVAVRQWYHTDSLGSVVARTDTTGAVVARFEYQAWGEQWMVPAVQGDRQFNGRVYDRETGFHDYGARMYWPEIGRFVSADALMGDPSLPVSLNRYSYVHNSPYNYVDPDGLKAVILYGAPVVKGFTVAPEARADYERLLVQSLSAELKESNQSSAVAVPYSEARSSAEFDSSVDEVVYFGHAISDGSGIAPNGKKVSNSDFAKLVDGLNTAPSARVQILGCDTEKSGVAQGVANGLRRPVEGANGPVVQRVDYKQRSKGAAKMPVDMTIKVNKGPPVQPQKRH